MLNISNELKAKLLAAQSAGEAAALMKADGQKLTAEDAAQLWTEIMNHQVQDDKELSLDEGCAATVEEGSDCWGADGGCLMIHYTYFREPVTDDRCPMCGARVYYEGEYGVSTGFLQGYNWKEFICRKCGSYKVKDDGTIF